MPLQLKYLFATPLVLLTFFYSMVWGWILFHFKAFWIVGPLLRGDCFHSAGSILLFGTGVTLLLFAFWLVVEKMYNFLAAGLGSLSVFFLNLALTVAGVSDEAVMCNCLQSYFKNGHDFLFIAVILMICQIVANKGMSLFRTCSKSVES